MDYHERKTKTRRAKNRYILLLSGYIRAGIICINGHIRVETARVRKAMVRYAVYRILFVHVWRNGYKSEWGSG